MEETMPTMQKQNEGRWTKAEHRKFLKYLEKYGRNWALIQKKIKTRTVVQVRSHAYKIFMKVPEQDMDAFIGYEDGCSDHWSTKKAKLASNFQQKRISCRLKQKLNQQKPKLPEEPTRLKSPEVNKQAMQHQKIVNEPIGNSKKKGQIDDEKSRVERTKFPSCQELSFPTLTLLDYLQWIQKMEYGGNFLLEALRQITLNGTLRTLNTLSFL